MDGLAQLANAKESRGSFLIVLSDGGDNASRLDLDHLGRQLQDKGVRLLLVPLHSDPRKTPEVIPNLTMMAEISKASGGFLVPDFSPTVVPPREIAKTVAAGLAGYSQFRLKLPPDARPSAKLEITFAHREKPEYKHAELFYPRRLSTCSE